MGDRSNIQGVLNIVVNDIPKCFDLSSISVNLGGDVFTPVDNKPGKNTVSEEASEFTFTVYPECNERITECLAICNDVVTIEEYNGRTLTMRGATRTGGGNVYDPSTGGLTITVTGLPIVETTNC